MEKLGKFDFFFRKTWKTQAKCKISDISPIKMYSDEFCALEWLGDNMKMPWKSEGNSGNLVFKNVTILC